jgi:cell division septation protein DedD
MNARPPLRTDPRTKPNSPKRGFVLAGFVRTLRKQAKQNLSDQSGTAELPSQPSASTPVKRHLLRTALLLAFLAISVPQLFSADATITSFNFSQNAASLASISDDVFGTPATVPPVPDAGLQIVQRNFDPVLVERLDDIGLPLPALADPVAGTAAPVISNEMLRVIAKMTPEQIDALTLLLLAQQGPMGIDPAPEAQPVSAANTDTSIWVGDWQDFIETPDNTPAPASSPDSEFLQGWRVAEVMGDTALIQNSDDPLSAITVVPGTILGSLGSVSEITVEDGFASVRLSSGAQINSDIDTVFTQTTPATVEPEVAADEGMFPEDEVAAVTDAVEPPAAEPAEAQIAQPEPATPRPSTQPAGDGLFIQVGTFKSEGNAGVALKMLEDQGLDGNVVKAGQGASAWHRVVAGPVARQDVNATIARLGGIGFKDAFVIR